MGGSSVLYYICSWVSHSIIDGKVKKRPLVFPTVYTTIKTTLNHSINQSNQSVWSLYVAGKHWGDPYCTLKTTSVYRLWLHSNRDIAAQGSRVARQVLELWNLEDSSSWPTVTERRWRGGRMKGCCVILRASCCLVLLLQACHAYKYKTYFFKQRVSHGWR